VWQCCPSPASAPPPPSQTLSEDAACVLLQEEEGEQEGEQDEDAQLMTEPVDGTPGGSAAPAVVADEAVFRLSLEVRPLHPRRECEHTTLHHAIRIGSCPALRCVGERVVFKPLTSVWPGALNRRRST
jgi:hypothetical protein